MEMNTLPESPRYQDMGTTGFQSQDLVIPPEKKEKITEEEIIKHPTTYMGTMMHLFKGNVGSGIFAMGDAFKNAGVVMAPWLVACLGIIAVHTQHILINASNSMKSKLGLTVQPNFAETVELCFRHGHPRTQKLAPIMRNLVKSFLCMGQLGFCSVYFVFISSNFKQILDHFGYDVDVRVLMACVLLPILGTCMVRNLKYLIPFSIVANILMSVGIVMAMYYASKDLPPLADAKQVANLQQFPLFFGTALFAVEGISLVLPLQREMIHPRDFDRPLGVLNVGMTIITTLYILVGFLSYLKYGEDVRGSITLNLPQDELFAIIVKILISLGIVLSYALQFYIPVQIIFNGLSSRFETISKHPKISEIFIRTFFVLLTFTLAETVPYLELFISLVGAFCSATICLIIPPIIDLVQHWNLEPPSMWILVKNLFILILGITICAFGSAESIRQIVEAFLS